MANPGTYSIHLVFSVEDLNDDSKLSLIDEYIRHAAEGIEANKAGTIINTPNCLGFFYRSEPHVNDEDYKAWDILYGTTVKGADSVECSNCGYTVFGDNTPKPIICWLCYKADQVKIRYDLED